MALPQVETTVLEIVAEEEANEKRQKAVAAAQPEQKLQQVVTQAVAASADPANDPASKQVAIAQASEAKGTNPHEFLASVGITDIKIDFTSFPTVSLNNSIFSTAEHKNFGTKFECVYLSKQDQFLFRGDLGRDKEPELVYSTDGITADKDGRPIAEYIEDWNSRGIPYERKEYTLVVVQMVDGPHEGEICMIQVSPASRGKLGGYLLGLGLKKIDPTNVVTEVSVGAEIGSGVKAFTPFSFKKVG